MQSEKLNASILSGASVEQRSTHNESTSVIGVYTVECLDSNGAIKWTEIFSNLVTTAGKNLALDTFLSGSGYTVTGPFMGLINGNAGSAVAGDTMASHSAWLEVGGANAPTYSGTRKTVAWSSAASGSKTTSSAVSFPITGSGTVGGCFIVFGSGAVATLDSTAGTLYSAGAFTGGSKTVANGDTLNVTYTASL